MLLGVGLGAQVQTSNSTHIYNPNIFNIFRALNMRILMILFAFAATLHHLPVVMADCDVDECIDENFDYTAAYRSYGPEWADEQLDKWFDRCLEICAAEFQTNDVNANNLPASKSVVVTDKSLWGAYVEGQSTPDMGNVQYPFDIYGVSWNHPNPKSALASATKECKERGGSNCGRGGRGEATAFSSVADDSGYFAVTRCIRVTITSTPSLSGLNQARMSYDLDNPMNPTPPFHGWGPGAKTLSNNIYCNDR